MKYRVSPCLAFGCLAVSILALPLNAQGPNLKGLYVPPTNSFILDPSENRIALDIGSAPLASVQQQLDNARAIDSDSPIVLTLTGFYLVTDMPLRLPSKTALVLYGTIAALPWSTAPSLISIDGQTQVSIAGGILEGNEANLFGIDAENATKVNIDAVTVRNTGKDGIFLKGAGNDVWDSGSAITRCEVTRAGGNGITIEAITQALVLDSFARNNKGAGIQVSAAYSSIVNNQSEDNDAGVAVDTNDNLISDNQIQGNRSAGLRLAAASTNGAVLRNNIVSNPSLGIDLDGSNHLVYANALHNAADLAEHGAGNWVLPRGVPLAAPLSQYFYPPTIDNRHSDPILNGRGRTDFTVDSGAAPLISQVQQIYDAMHQQHPDDVLVMTLTGQFTLDGDSLLLQSHTVAILDATIQVPATSSAAQAITAANPSEFIAISGGTIDLSGRSAEGIFLPSTTMAFIEHVTVKNGGQRDVRAGKGMLHLARGGGYSILHANSVDNTGGRCIWTQNANTRYVAIENHLTNCNQDGVDFDSSTSNSFAIGNVTVDSLRYGVFIEQSDSFDKIYGNTTTTQGLNGSTGHGVGIYNNATSAGTRGITDKNTVFSNASDVISNGLRVGSISTATGGVAETAHSFLFNNVATNSKGDAILFDTQFARSIQNYFSQTVLAGNHTDLDSHPSNDATPPEFFNPPSAVNLALRQPAAASSSGGGSTPAAAVDGLSYTSWMAGPGLRSSLTIDLGSVVSFRRVTLKRTPAPILFALVLQSSQDGVTFANIPGTARIVDINEVDNIAFGPVSARFVRVQIERFLGGPIGFEEISVHPE